LKKIAIGVPDLEGLGYLAAIMIGVSGVAVARELLRLFFVIGIGLAVIVIVRLLAINASLALKHQEEGKARGQTGSREAEEETVQ
jgi:hypothetical protein